MADLKKTPPTIDHDANGKSSRCLEATGHIAAASLNPLERQRVSAGDGERHKPQCNCLRHSFVLRSSEHSQGKECHPCCQVPNFSSSQYGNQNKRNPRDVRSSEKPPGNECHLCCPQRGNQAHNFSSSQYGNQNQRNPRDVRSCEKPPGNECHPCCPQRGNQAQNFSSSQYGNQNQRNPRDVRSSEKPPGKEYYPSCPCRGQQVQAPQTQRPQSCCTNCSGQQKKYQSPSKDFTGGTRRVQRTSSSHYMEYNDFQHPVCVPSNHSAGSQGPRQRRHSIGTCGSRTSQRRQSVCSCESSRTSVRRHSVGSCGCCTSAKRRSPEKSPSCKFKCLRKKTPAAPTYAVRSHPCPQCQGAPPKRTPSKRTSSCFLKRKCKLLKRSPSASKPGNARCCSSSNDKKYKPISSSPSDYMEKSRSGTACVRNPITQNNTNYNIEAPVARQRSRSSACRKPPLCSNETLMEKPMRSYRFSCPENRKCPGHVVKLCPRCHKALRQTQRCLSASRRCASGAARKFCSKCGGLERLPKYSSNRCIYKTLSRKVSRPIPIFKTRYELTLCCANQRCQGGKNRQTGEMGEVTSNLKRSGANSVPTRTSMPRSNYPNSHMAYSNSKPAASSPATSGLHQNRTRPSADHHQGRTAPPPTTHQRHHSDHMAPMSRRDPPPMAHHSGTSKLPPQVVSQTEPPLPPSQRQKQRTRPLEEELPSSSRRHHSQRERSQPKDQIQEQQHHPRKPSHQVAPHPRSHPEPPAPAAPAAPAPPSYMPPPQPRSQPEPPESASAYLPPLQQHILSQTEMSEYQQNRGANFLGTEVNPYYRGGFLRTRSSIENSHPNSTAPGQQRTLELSEQKKSKKRGSNLMPPKWTGLGQLQSWVFGDSVIERPVVEQRSDNGTWSWRQIFGRSKKRHGSKTQGVDQ